MNKIENANIIGLLKNDVIISKIKGENEFIVRYNENQEIICEKKYINTGNKFICGTKIIIYEGEYTTILDVNTGSFLNKENRYYIKNNCNYIVYFELDNSKELFINGNKIENFSRLKVFGSNKVFFSDINEPFIKSVNFIDNVDLFLFNAETYFHQPAQIMEGRVLVSNNKIIFFAHTEDWSNYATFVLDAQTGKVLNNPKETIFGGKMYLFDGFLWQKKDKGFAKMNPETFEITHYDLTKDLPTEIIDNRTMAYHNGIIAVSAKPERDSIRSLVLLFDTNTGKIIWRKEILHNESKPSNNENRRQIEEIQMNDKYLAVSTTGFSLYIFEKQDVESK